MKIISSRLVDSTELVSYKQYCAVLSCISRSNNVTASIEQSGIFDSLMGGASQLKELFAKFGTDISELAKEKGIQLKDLAKAFADKGLFNLLKSVKFNLSGLVKALHLASSLIDKGLLKVFHQLQDTGLIAKLRSGAIKLNDLIVKYPILKHVTGIAIAGLLLYMWISMSFTGNVSNDFDLSNVIDALQGNFSLDQLLLSPSGMKDIFLCIVGVTTGISFPYLLGSGVLLLGALAYTVLKKHGGAIATKLEKGVKLVHLKI